MTGLSAPPADRSARRPFAAKYSHQGWGIGLGIFGVLAIIASFTPQTETPESGSSNPFATILVGLGAIAWAVYLLRGQGKKPVAGVQAVAPQQRYVAPSPKTWEQATADLAAATTASAAIIAHRNIQVAAARDFPQDPAGMVEQAIVEAGFDRTLLASPRYGYVAALGGGSVEFFRDCVIFGQEGHDVESTTRGQVYVDGTVQVTSSVVHDSKGRQQIVERTHDLRIANVQLTSGTWTMSFGIDPQIINEARRYVEQTSIRAGELQPRNATAADIRDMVDAILENTGQPPAEKLTQLSNLRYDRLLSDDEFQRAKNKILGL